MFANPSGCCSLLLTRLLMILSFGPKLSPGQDTNAPPCPEGTLQCPVSRACYLPEAICDTYDDCGTGFDEINCSGLNMCNEADYTPFDNACAIQRSNGTFMSRGRDFIFNGEFFFGIPSLQGATAHFIDRVYLDWGLNQNDWPSTRLTERGFFLITILSINSTDSVDVVVSSTTLALHLTANEANVGVMKKLRVPFEIDTSVVSSVEVMLTYVNDTDPSFDNPYRPPQELNYGTLEVEFVRYDGACPANPFPFGDACITSVLPYLNLEDATICQPPERRLFVSALYGSCISPCAEPGAYQCPVSRACYLSEAVCDSYDDCGTGFDETNCPKLVECNEADYTPFDNACGTQRSNGTFMSRGRDFIFNGEFFFGIPSVEGAIMLYIDRVYLDWGRNQNDWPSTQLEGKGFFMIRISAVTLEGTVISSTTVALQLTSSEANNVVMKKLRQPMEVDISTINSIDVMLGFVNDTDPSMDSPYMLPEALNYGTLEVEFVRYVDACPTNPFPYGDSCLMSVLPYLNLNNATSCQPREREVFVTSLYGICNTQCAEPDAFQCPESRACYHSNALCDTYDDCGTGLDEANCPGIVECNEADYTPFDNACGTQRSNGTFMSRGRDFIFNGEFFFGIPSMEGVTTLYIDRVYLEWGINLNDWPLTQFMKRGFFIIRISSVTNQGNFIASTTIALELTQNEANAGVVKKLREPFEIDVSTVGSMEVTLGFVGDGVPSTSNPYTLPEALNYGTLEVEFVRYVDPCPANFFPFGDACLTSVLPYLDMSGAMPCQPQERLLFVSSLYGSCVSPCPEGTLQCPVSRACYLPEAICDSYDDCGTGFDEMNCPAVECNEADYTPFDDACGTQRSNGTFMSRGRDFIFNGEFFFGIPSLEGATMLYIDRVYLNWGMNQNDWPSTQLIERGYFLIEISSVSTEGNVLMSTTVALHVTVNEANGSVVKKLREPFEIDISTVNSMEVRLAFVKDADPSTDNPYVLPQSLNYGTLEVEFVRYIDPCPSSPFQYSSPCLISVLPFLDAEVVTSCQPEGRQQFVTSRYGSCVLPCPEGTLQCPVSRACYLPEAICDSYDDCGTGFDEINCPGLDECNEAVYTQFDSACSVLRTNATYETDLDFVPNGEFTFDLLVLESASMVYVDRVHLNWGINQNNWPSTQFTDVGYFMLRISVVDRNNTITNSEMLTLQLNANESMAGIFKKLREPMEVNGVSASHITVTLGFVGDAEPSIDNPYILPMGLSYGTLQIEYVTFVEPCPGNRFHPCLNAVLPYLNADVATACQPPERQQFVSSMYESCILPMSCPEGTLQCPLSKACYPSDALCDSYDDCGTGFDELDCPDAEECNATIFRAFDTACAFQRGNGTFDSRGRDFVFNGEFFFGIPAFDTEEPIFIDRVYLDWGMNENSWPSTQLTDKGYFMFLISSVDSAGNVRNLEIVTLRLTANESRSGVVKKLRAPFEIDMSVVTSVEVVLGFVRDAEPSTESSYVAPPSLNHGTVDIEFVSYLDACRNIFDRNRDACLNAAFPYLRRNHATSCTSLERRLFVSSQYGNCISPPVIDFISPHIAGNVGDFVFVSCSASGSPRPSLSMTPIIDPESSGEPFPFGPVTVNQGFVLSNGTNITFTCTAENIAGTLTAQVQVRALDYRCPDLEVELANFQRSNLTGCPPVVLLPPSGIFFTSFFTFTAQQDGILQSWQVTFFQPNPEIPPPSSLSFRITVTTDQFLPGGLPARRKRDILTLLYEKDYSNAPLVNGGMTIEFTPSVFVPQSTTIFVNLLTLNDQPLADNLPFNNAPTDSLAFLQCPLSPPLNPFDNASCYEQLESLAILEANFVDFGCADEVSLTFQNYETCLRVGDAQPVVTGEVPVPELKISQNFDIPCPIEGAVRRQWWRRTSRGLRTPFQSPSPFLRFTPFTVDDMGYYLCEGYGGGIYRDETVTTAAVLLMVEEVTTIVISITFDTEYIDFEQMPMSLSQFRQPIQNAFFNDRVSLVSRSLLDEIDTPSFPTIVNTRNGSLIVDYAINVNGSMWENNATGLVDETTNLLESNINMDGGSSLFESSGSPISIVPGSIVVSIASMCPESVVCGSFGTLTFPSTLLDQTADSKERCNEYSNNTPLPRARRTCRGDLVSAAVWEDPVLVDCFVGEDTNEVLDNIARAVVTADNVTEYSYDVVEATANQANISTEGIRAVADALQKIVDIRDPSLEVTNNTIFIVDNVLDVPDEGFEEAIDVEAPTRILDFLELQITLFQTQGNGENLTIVGSSVAVVALQLPEASLLEGLGFATLASPGDMSNVLSVLDENRTMVYFNPDEIPKTIIEASIILPAAILEFLPPELLANGTVPITFFIFQTSKLFNSPDQIYDLGGGRRLAVGTRIISATVEGVIIENLPEGNEVETAFLELNVTLDTETVDNRTCVFWEKTIQGGRWSSEGCRREDNPDINRIRCLCDHLTSFAVLLDISGDIGLKALDILGMIGCIISIICLVITLVTYLSMQKLRSKQPQRILINLCIALLGLYLVFVIGIDRRYPTAGCVVVGFLIHFFLLSSMMWMLVEAVNMYLLFVKVLDASISRFMLKASLCAYGLPLVVCIVTVAVDSTLYLGDGTYCFVKPGPALYYGVLLIVALLLTINFIIFGLVMQRLSCRKSVSAHKTGPGSRGETWRRVQNAVAISVLLGLTWLFGFLAIGGARVVFNILFLVFNSLQGFFVFLMFCIRQKDVREQWVRWMHCEFSEVKPGQRRSEDYVKNKYKPKREGQTSSSQGTSIPLTSGGTLSTSATLERT